MPKPKTPSAPETGRDSHRRPTPELIVRHDDPAGGPPIEVDLDTLDESARHQVYEQVKRADYEIPKLQALPMAELQQLARDAGVSGTTGLNRQELIFNLLKSKVTSQGLGWGEGTLDILPDGFGFLRSRRYNYKAGPDDIYVSPSQIRRLNLKQGHQLAGPVRPPKESEKYFALLRVEMVNGASPEALEDSIPFESLTPILPTERLALDAEGVGDDLRLVDLLAPMGRGQRTLILSPPHSGRTVLMTNLAQALLNGNPDLYLIMLMLDERPEEVTEAVRSTGPDERREVVASTFDEPSARHIDLAEMALRKAQRLVETGKHVVVMLDSLTSLVRAYNYEVPHSGKILAAGLDAVALHESKRLFGAARAVEEGGSLTVIATALTDTGSRINDVVVEEFKGKGNCEIVLDAHLSSLHIYPPIDVLNTGTRREDTLLSSDDVSRLRRLRREIDRGDRADTLEQLSAMVIATADNRELLDSL